MSESYEMGRDVGELKARIAAIEQQLCRVVPGDRTADTVLACRSSDHSDPATDTRAHVRRYYEVLVQKCVRSSMSLHLGKVRAEQIVNGIQQATEAVSGGLLACGLPVAAAWVTVGGMLFAVGYNTTKNPDGSVDITVRQEGEIRAGGIVLTYDPFLARQILESF